jgi:hypothetical protein
MRLGLTSWNPIERLVAATGLYPSPLLLGFWGMASSRTLMAGVALGVFESLSEGPRTAEEVAEATGCDPVGTEALLNALNGFGYIRRRRGRYANRPAVRRWLLKSARFPLTGAFGLFEVLWDELGDVEDRLRSGETHDFHADRGPLFWTRYQAGLAQFARLAAPEIVRRVPLMRPRRLLDVGGGHATYAAAFCRRYPDLAAEVIDLPGGVAMGRKFMAEAGMSERVGFREADLLTDDWGEGHDAILLFNVVHTIAPEQAPLVFAKARDALASGGTFVVLDSAHKGPRGDIDTAGGANELLFWVINGTRAYPEERIRSWMAEAGFSTVHSRHLVTVPQAALIVGQA